MSGGYRLSPMLISASDLAARISDARLSIIDVRWYLADPSRGRREYEAGHIPTSVFCDLEADLTGQTGPGRHPLPRPEAFTATLRRLGVHRDHAVVAYDDSGGSAAARLWWMLRSIGHPEVSVLDGGFSEWTREERPVTQAIPRVKPGSYTTALEWSGVIDREGVAAGGHPLIDARAPERYRGEVEPIDPKAGHIPGAVNLAYAGNLGPDGRFLSPADLARRYEPVGPSPVVYCGSGVTACHGILALAIAGRTDALLYEGSWSDWSRQTDSPVGLGDRP